MKRTLIVIDMQKDFIDGALGTKEAVSIVPNVKNKIQEYYNRGDEIIYTRDTHHKDYMETREGKYLPVIHCTKESDGWEIPKELMIDNSVIIDKPDFGYGGWKDYKFEEVELIGLCTDICVVTNALLLRTYHPKIKITVDASCCAGVTPESHEAALLTMKMCQIEIV